MATTVSLAQMVDLALGTPEVGAVNFNVLHSLLHAMLSKLDLAAVTTQLSSEDRDLLTSTSEKTTSPSGKDGEKTGKDGESPAGGTGGGTPGAKTGATPYHVLQKKVAKLEEEMEKLNQLPTNADLMERSRPLADGERPRPVADMWQSVQLKNRVDANEEGIGKLMSLVEDMMAEMTKVKAQSDGIRNDLDNHNIPGLRSDVEDLSKKLDELDIQSLRDLLAQLKKDLEGLTNKMNNMADLDDLRKRLKDLENLTNDLNDKLNTYPPADKFEDFVTWTALEEALRGLRKELEPPERIVIEMQTQTSRPPSAKEPPRTPSPKGPSEELTKMLEDLGILTERHNAVDTRVVKLEEEMSNKADKSDLAGLSSGGKADVPDDLLAQLKDLQDQLKALGKARDKLTQLEEKLAHLAGLEENIDGLNLGQDDLQKMIDALRAEYESNMASLEEKLRALQELALSASAPVTPPPPPPARSPSPEPVKLPPIPGATPPPPAGPKLAELEEALSRKEAEMRALQQKMKFLMQDTNKQLADLKEKLKALERELLSLAKQKQPTPTRSRHSDMGRKITPLTASSNTSTASLPKLPSSVEVLSSSAPSTLPPSLPSLTRVIPESGLGESQGTVMSLPPSTTDLVTTTTAATTTTTTLPPQSPPSHQSPPASSSSLPLIDPQDSDTLSRLQQIVLQLQAELDRVTSTAQRLVDENNNKTKLIENLTSVSEKLDRDKADKEYVQSEVDVKADKRMVEGKVNRSLFDQTTDELNKMIKELLDKLSGHEDEWKQALGGLNEDVDGKLDRLEFGPIRDELERRLKALARQLRELSLREGDVEDDAAGIRKQLLRFQCISCDRPVDMTQHGPIPSIPAPPGLPATRSSRPYTTFELEQIRQHARRFGSAKQYRENSAMKKGLTKASNFERVVLERKCWQYGLILPPLPSPPTGGMAQSKSAGSFLQQPGVEVVDLYATARACGGTHTMTHPHRRITRATTQYNNLFRDEEVPQPTTRESHRLGIEELDIQGADGHIYKGRIEARLPTSLQQSAPGVANGPHPSGQSPKMSRKVIYTQTGAARGPAPPTAPQPPNNNNNSRSPRPSSARVGRPAIAPDPTQSAPAAPLVKQATIPTATTSAEQPQTP